MKNLEEAVKLAEAYQKQRSEERLGQYNPYPYQSLFHEGLDMRGEPAKQRLLMAAKKVGKTFCGATELAIHLTGLYPDWWQGHRFDNAIRAWGAGNTTANTRDIVQTELLGEAGEPDEFGTGTIPKGLIVKTERLPGIPNAISTVSVKHVSGKNSKLWFKSYEQGKEQWMGVAVDACWLDEEPPQNIYSQALRASLKTNGLIWMTFTPESGMTNTVAQFLNNIKPGQQLVNATWEDAPHLDEEAKQQILEGLPPHERRMRSQGLPILGSGLVFPVDEEVLKTESFAIPSHWPRIAGIDFGWDHPTAVVWAAWDRDQDSIYIYDCYRMSGETPTMHAAAVKLRGEDVPVAWPHAGMQHDKGSGVALKDQYVRLGVNMLGQHATNPDGSNSVEPGIMDMLTRMQTGRYKVFDHLSPWFEELRMYHRQDGKIIKERDDLMSATRYLVMSLMFSSAGRKQEGYPEVALGTLDRDYPFYQMAS